MQLSLLNNKGFQWLSKENTYLKGYFFDKKNIFYQKEDALNYLSKITNKTDFTNTIKTLNGCFTICININNQCFIATDTTRIFPIFYTYQNDQLHISDDIHFLKNNYNLSDYNPIAETELKSTLHTYGKKTLLESVYQIQSNEYLVIEEEQIIEQSFYFSYATSTYNKNSYHKLKEQTIHAFENAFERLITTLNNKTVLLPLSGGYDSRLIAVMLKKYNYTKVICYTYGKPNSFEIANSKKTAETLGYRWLFIPYSEKRISDCLNCSDFKAYAHYAGKHSAMPNPQEYFAVKYLQENERIPDDAIFIPGYAGDLLGGSQFLKVIPKKLKRSQIIDLLITSKFTNYPLKPKEKKSIKNQLTQTLNSPMYQNKTASSIFEDLDIKEKITKYIFNSANFYTFFNYQHRFPFWDHELLTFFKTVPEKHKFEKSLFDDVLIHHYFKPFNVYFEKELQPSRKMIILQKVKNKMRPFLPTFIKQQFLEKNSWINYLPLVKELEKELTANNLQLKKQYKSYNETIVQWYVFLAKERFK